MASTQLVITRALLDQIQREGAEAFPNECCGLMIGQDRLEGGMTKRIVQSLKAVPNVFDEEERYHRFSIDPKTLMQADREAGAQGKLVLGFYHSHPNAPARPSEYDRQHGWPFYSYLIVSVMDGKPSDTTSWQLEDSGEKFNPEPVEIV